MGKSTLVRALVLGSLLFPFAAGGDEVARPDSHAPIGVMGDHRHAAGEVMFSYRYARMSMRGDRDGTDRLRLRSVLRSFPVAPFSMDMEKHLFGAMWAPTDRLTLMAMVPFLRLDMDHRTRSGLRFRARSRGLGDVRLMALVGLPSCPPASGWTGLRGATSTAGTGTSIPGWCRRPIRTCAVGAGSICWRGST